MVWISSASDLLFTTPSVLILFLSWEALKFGTRVFL